MSDSRSSCRPSVAMLQTVFWATCLSMAMPPVDAQEEVAVTARATADDDSPWMAAATRFDVDPVDLYAIALQESRRHRPDGQVRPWPWTLHAPDEGSMYFDTYEQAADKLSELIARGVTNVDIGVMQVNWSWNGHRFPDPAKLLLPKNNIQVAAEILRENLDEYGGDLRIAIARYHSARIEHGIPYAAAVLTIRDRLKKIDGLQLALAF